MVNLTHLPMSVTCHRTGPCSVGKCSSSRVALLLMCTKKMWQFVSKFRYVHKIKAVHIRKVRIPNSAQVALWLLGFAGLSDLADGWIARTWTSQASKLGSVLDPVADKLLVGTLFLSLTWVDLIPIPLTILVIARDVILISCASFIRYRSLPPPVNYAQNIFYKFQDQK